MAKNIDKEPADRPAAEPAVSSRPAKAGAFSTQPSRNLIHGLGAVLLLAVVFSLGVAAASHNADEPMGFKAVANGGGPGIVSHHFGGEQGFGAGGHMYSTESGSQSSLNGVVTAISGSSFTVAGHGATTNVTTSSSTQYHNGNEVKVNDSVIVMGASSSGTITATSVIINP